MYKSYEMNYSIKQQDDGIAPTENLVIITFSKFGLIEIKNSLLEDSLEIVRRIVDRYTFTATDRNKEITWW